MTKPYVNRELRSGDSEKIEALVRRLEPLVPTPSNINDIYDVQAYRKENLVRNIEFKALLDNNIVTYILPLVDGRKVVEKALDGSVLNACAIMCFLIYAGIEANPGLGIYEQPSDLKYLPKEKRDYYFRIADSLHPQVYADLALKRIVDIPSDRLADAKIAVDSNAETQKNIEESGYEEKMEDEEPFFFFLYTNVLKIWMLYKEEKDKEKRLSLFLDWTYSESLSGDEILRFAIIFLSNDRIKKMIKHMDSSDSAVILKELKNSTWDLCYLYVLQKFHQDSGKDEIWFFITQDKALLGLSKSNFAFATQEGLSDFINKYYSTQGKQAFEIYIKKINSRSEEDRGCQMKKVESGMEEKIETMEEEVRNILKT